MNLLPCRPSRELATLLVAILLANRSIAAASFTEWQQRQAFEVTAFGLSRITLSAATLDAGRPGLEDVRLVDPMGNEVPYVVERPAREPPLAAPPKSFKPALRGAVTIVDIETGVGVPIDALTLETPEREFIKAVRLEGSRDGQHFTEIVDGAPLFRQEGASELTVRFPAAAWTWLRLTLDDQRSPPVAWTGARVQAAEASQAPAEQVAASLKSREESAGDTRLVLDLGAGNLTLATIEFDTPEALFRREVVVRAPEIVGEEIRELDVAQDLIYAVDVAQVSRGRKTSILLERQVRSRELIVLVRNLDSPALALSGVHVERRPVFLIFEPRQAGQYFLYVGNSQCPAPRYDLVGLSAQLRTAPSATLTPGPLALNPEYRPPGALPGLAETAAPLDTGPWRYRKPLQLAQPGAQQLELDLNVLAHARADLADLRLMRNGAQVPYVIERTSLTRALTPVVTMANDPKQPQMSRWKITLPAAKLPVMRLECQSRTPLFQRTVQVWEELPDGRGGKFRSGLGRAEWQRTSESKLSRFSVPLNDRPQTDTLFLTTDNGDNPPLELDSFRIIHPVIRLVFKASQAPTLYYGHASASAPRYDLSLVAMKLLSADKAMATPGAEEPLKKERVD